MMKRQTNLFILVIGTLLLMGCTPLATPPPPANATVLPSPNTFVLPSSTPVQTSTETSEPLLVESPTSCFAEFSPVGFWPDADHLLGRYRVEGQEKAQLQILDLNTSQTATVWEYRPSSADLPVLSPTGDVAAVALADFSVQVVNLTDGTVRAALTGHRNNVTAMGFSPAGDWLYTGSMDTWVKVWDLEGNMLAEFQPDGADGFPSEVTGLAFPRMGRNW